jgi:hypothetical protein
VAGGASGSGGRGGDGDPQNPSRTSDFFLGHAGAVQPAGRAVRVLPGRRSSPSTARRPAGADANQPPATPATPRPTRRYRPASKMPLIQYAAHAPAGPMERAPCELAARADAGDGAATAAAADRPARRASDTTPSPPPTTRLVVRRRPVPTRSRGIAPPASPGPQDRAGPHRQRTPLASLSARPRPRTAGWLSAGRSSVAGRGPAGRDSDRCQARRLRGRARGGVRAADARPPQRGALQRRLRLIAAAVLTAAPR